MQLRIKKTDYIVDNATYIMINMKNTNECEKRVQLSRALWSW